MNPLDQKLLELEGMLETLRRVRGNAEIAIAQIDSARHVVEDLRMQYIDIFQVLRDIPGVSSE